MTKGLILDRDGVINVDDGYVGAAGRFAFMPGLFPFLRACIDKGYRLAVATNQSGVARGFYTQADHDALTAHMRAELKREGIEIALALACFEHPDGAVPAYKRESFWRKPHPGMALEIVRRLRLDPARSAFLGDAPRDMEAAQGAGIARCLWLTTETNPPPGVRIVADFQQALAAL